MSGDSAVTPQTLRLLNSQTIELLDSRTLRLDRLSDSHTLRLSNSRKRGLFSIRLSMLECLIVFSLTFALSWTVGLFSRVDDSAIVENLRSYVGVGHASGQYDLSQL